MTTAICSLFRDSASKPELARYRRQIMALDWPTRDLRVYCLEGDSTDNTLDELHGWAMDDSRIKVMSYDQGTVAPQSIEDVMRLRALSEIMAVCMGAALKDGCEQILWIESDLIWQPDLLKRLAAHDVDAIAPWIYVNLGGQGCDDIDTLTVMGEHEDRVFYDTWAFRRLEEMQRFEQLEIVPEDMQPFAIASAGSCLLMSAEAARSAVVANDLALVGSCQYIRDAGYTVYCDPATVIWHPWPRGT